MAASITDIKKLIFSADGSPFAKISVGATVLGTSQDGSPWWGVPEPEATTTTTTTSVITSHIKKVIGVSYTNIKKVIGIPIANVKELIEIP